jgi:hypothetical protein
MTAACVKTETVITTPPILSWHTFALRGRDAAASSE